jgi:hypothetical protein
MVERAGIERVDLGPSSAHLGGMKGAAKQAELRRQGQLREQQTPKGNRKGRAIELDERSKKELGAAFALLDEARFRGAEDENVTIIWDQQIIGDLAIEAAREGEEAWAVGILWAGLVLAKMVYGKHPHFIPDLWNYVNETADILSKKIGESKKAGYTYRESFIKDVADLVAVSCGEAPSSEAADTSPPLRMREQFNRAAKEAKAERTAAGRLANYEFLIGNVDLENPELDPVDRLRRAEHLLTTYKRLRKVNANFYDDSPQLKAARSITNRANYPQVKAKRASAAKKAKLSM